VHEGDAKAEKDLLRSAGTSQFSKPTYDQLEAMARFEVLFSLLPTWLLYH